MTVVQLWEEEDQRIRAGAYVEASQANLGERLSMRGARDRFPGIRQLIDSCGGIQGWVDVAPAERQKPKLKGSLVLMWTKIVFADEQGKVVTSDYLDNIISVRRTNGTRWLMKVAFITVETSSASSRYLVGRSAAQELEWRIGILLTWPYREQKVQIPEADATVRFTLRPASLWPQIEVVEGSAEDVKANQDGLARAYDDFAAEAGIPTFTRAQALQFPVRVR